MILSLPKLLGLVAVIWLIWVVLSIYETRRATIRAKQTKDAEAPSHNDQTDTEHLVDLRECKKCGAWVSGENCGCEN